ncbi:type I polyketide synthase, partial [Streptomyces sp. NPDC005955]|uniref:type I polyketide synthase n=1 Tax=Streptomyces sp. NPDC005955 TaxID=3364738 RepID=UPI0036BFE8A5
RLMLEVAWEAVERAGIDPHALRGSRTGVYAGTMFHDQGPEHPGDLAGIDGQRLVGGAASVLSGRVAFTLGLEGPAVTLDTACSSSLVALHLAAQALRKGECSLALAGGVTVMSNPVSFVGFSRQRGLAPDGRCKAYASGADGTGWSEGIGLLVVEKLSDAVANGHPVLAVLRGSAVNQDGASNGLTAPNGPAQQRVIRAALADAGLSGADVDVVEGHGTGTKLGDPIEAQALLATYGQDRPEGRPLWLGSVKSNLGHTQGAAGAASIIKLVEAMRHGTVPKTLHVDEPSSFVDWDSGAVALATERVHWPRGERPRRAGISSFGISGTNAHVIIEEPAAAAPVEYPPAQDGPLPLLLSAHTPQALRDQARQLLPLLRDGSVAHHDLARALATTRAALEHRAVVTGTGEELEAALTAFASGTEGPETAEGVARTGPAVFVFPGQGSQWVGMARELLAESTVFAERMAECEAALAPFVDWSLVELVRRGDDWERVDVVQPALFSVMVSLAAVWRSCGVEPAAVVGHSQGEIAAAVVAGGLSLQDGAQVVALRSRALRALAGEGGMASVALPADRVEALLGDRSGRLSVAAVNGPGTTVVAGDREALDAFVADLVAEGVRTRTVPVDYASHSVHVERIRTELLDLLARITPRSGAVPFFSTVDGAFTDTAGLDADYWYRNLRGTVAFAPAVRALAEAGHTAFIEISPHPVLTASTEDTVRAADVEATVLGTLRRDDGGLRRLLHALGEAWAHGLPVDRTALTAGPAPRHVALPTYPFQRRRYWPEPAELPEPAADDLWRELEVRPLPELAALLDVDAEVLGRVLPALASWRSDRSATWRHEITWAPLTPEPKAPAAGAWLLVTPEGTGDAIAGPLTAVGLDLIRVHVTDPGHDRAALADLLRRAVGERAVAGVISFLAEEQREHPAHPGLPAALPLTLALVQALGDAAITAPLWCVTREVATVGYGEQPGPAVHAAVAGLCRTVALEHPDRWGGLLDLPAEWDDRAAARVRTVLATVRDEDHVAVRPTGTYGRRLRIAPPDARREQWPTTGTALITGGTGGLGAHLARRLAAEGVPHLLLVSRRGPDAPGATALHAELTATGAAVTLARCDVGDPDQIAALLATVPAEQPLTAVFHAAGVLDDGTVDALTPDRLASVYRVKHTAAHALHEATLGHDLTAFVLFSSLTGTLGAAGQANYAAANAALDALAGRRRAAGLPATSVAWGVWAGDGMASRRDADRLGDIGVRAMAPEAALRALGRVLAGAPADAVVADVDWPRFAEVSGVRSTALLSALPGVDAPGDPAQDSTSLRSRLAPLSPPERLRSLTALVGDLARRVLGHAPDSEVRETRAFTELGFDSLNAVQLRNRIGTATGLRLPTTLLFDHATPQALAAHLVTLLVDADPPTAEPVAPTPLTASGAADDPIAIVGIGCRFPGGAHGPDALWRLLSEGRDAVTDWPEDRGWDTARLHDPARQRPGTTYSRRGGFLRDVAGFDAAFFGISPREALAMDPQQRLLLETTWEAVEHAGIDPASLRGSSVGVFVGTNGQDYTARLAGVTEETEGHFLTGNTASVLSGRVSYTLGVEGPALTVDTACSASLVSLHLAVQSLRRGECAQALAGGVTIMSTPTLFVEFSRQNGLAPDGRCKAFGAGADGTVWGEGAGVLLLERLSEARRLGHRVLALVGGTAVNQDGASNGLTAPNGTAQQQVIRAALADAALTPADIDAVEAHGTGTSLGDPIEAQALQAVYGSGRHPEHPLWFGSVKSNIGHTQAAAGVAGVIKLVLAMQHGVLPRTLHADEPSPHVDWSAGGTRLSTGAREWPGTGRPRRSAVSSFGISGTNAHVVLQEAPATRDEPPADEVLPTPLLLSAATGPALAAQAARLDAHVQEHPATAAVDVARTLATARAGLRHRAAVLRPGDEAMRRALAALAAAGTDDHLITGTTAATGATAFLFPGQGSQIASAGAELHRCHPVFADALDEVLAHFAPHFDVPLRDVMFATGDGPYAGLLHRTRYTQPALFALGVALHRLLAHHGVRPDLLIGHSVGELTAAHLAGVLSLADACTLVAARGRLMDELPDGGVMVAVEAGEDEVRALLTEDTVSVAAVNGPTAVVLSGEAEAVEAVAGQLRGRGRRVRRLEVSHAFHSTRMAPMLDAFRRVAASVTYAAPRLPVVSNLTGEPATGDDLRTADYWVRHVSGTVRFLDGARSLHAAGATTFVEVGPGRVLSTLLAGALADAPAAVPLLGPQDTPEPHAVTAALAALWVRGAPVAWHSTGHPVDLPTYPFEHRRFWPRELTAAPGTATDPADAWRYRVTWEPLTAALRPRLGGPWLLVVPDTGADALAETAREALTAYGAEVTVVSSGCARSTTLADRLDELGGAAAVAGVLSLLALGDDPLTATLRLVQETGRARITAPLWCLTAGVAQDGPPVPEQAQVWGFGRVAALELPERWGGLVDVPGTAHDGLARQLAAALAGTFGTEDQIALRPDGAHGRRLVRDVPTPEPSPSRWATKGTVLITGGTGGIGVHLARALAADGAEHLVLTSRRGPDAPGAGDLVAELGRLGARVTVEACDVADRAALGSLLDRLRAADDLPRAVFHAAGTVTATRIEHCTPQQWHDELAAKAVGASHLDALFADEPLDAFVLFSSIAGVWGSGGQSGYAAANAHLDALAARRRARGLPATSVAWGPWAGTGMADGDAGTSLRAHGLDGLEPAAALDALRRTVDRGGTCVVLADVTWERFAPPFTAARPSALLRGIPEATTPDAPAANDTTTGWRRRFTALPRTARLDLLHSTVVAEAARALGHDGGHPIDPDRPLRELGFDSLTTVDLRNRLVAATGLSLPATLVFDHPTADALARYLHTQLTGADETPDAPVAHVGDSAEPLAVVAMACRFPGGVRSPDDLWRLVTDGTDAIAPMPADRGWDLAALYDPDPEHPGTFSTTGGGFLDTAGDFDAEFFGISPREALAMDPQHRLLLEAAWEALEGAGIDPTRVKGTAGGVFVGVAGQGYGSGPAGTDVEGHLLTGNVSSVASGRIAYHLGIEGPAVTLDTACSSSLVALHLAGQALRSGECSFALVGGAAVMAGPDVFVEFSRQRGLSPDGRCRAFGDAADGTGWGEGVGMLVVERLSEARRHGHPVLAVVRGSAVNQDGASNGLTAPNGPAQQRVIRQALANAGVEAAEVDLVEAHGTGTVLGDPIEAQALLATYGQDRPEGRPLRLGSLKSNIGHTQAAAGVAGIIKTVQALRHGVLPRTLHADEPSSRVDWSAGEVALLAEALPWTTEGRPRRAAVSAFGMSGTNAHVILEEAATAETSTTTGAPPAGAVPWVLSARTEPALRAQAARLRTHLALHPELTAGVVARDLAGTRTAFPVRAALVGAADDELRAALTAVADGQLAAGVTRGNASPGRTVFVFPGQGSQWPKMAADLLDTAPEFAARIADCERALAPHVDWSLTDVLRSAPGAASLDRVDVVQPALFAVMVALAAQWRALGVEPDAVIGHSQGEIAAACVAGALSLDDAAATVALRSRALRTLHGTGSMLSLAAPRDRVEELLAPYGERVCVAAVNGPAAVTVAGDPESLTALADAAAREGVRTRRLPVDYASHSPHVAAVREELLTELADLRPRPAEVPLHSTVTGEYVDGETLDAAYWYRNLRETVEFARSTARLLDDGFTRFIEVSPHPVLTAGVDGCAEEQGRPVTALGTLRRDDGGWPRLLTALGDAWADGAAVAWERVPTVAAPGTAVPLPTYAFQHERHWLPTPGRRDPAASTDGPGLAYRTRWQPAPETTGAPLDGNWLLLVPDGVPRDHPAVTACERALSLGGAQPTVLDWTGRAGAELLAGAGRSTGIVSLLALAGDTTGTEPTTAPAALVSTVELVRALDSVGSTAPLWCVTTSAVAVGDEPPSHPGQAGLWGLGQVLLLEQEARFGGLLDLPAAPGDDLARRIASLLAGGHDEDQIALRDGGRFVRRLVRADGPVAPAPQTWTPAGRPALVTGGLTPLTAGLARWLAGGGATRVLLTDAAGSDDTEVRELRRELADLGAHLTVTDRDATDPAVLDALDGQAPGTLVHLVAAGEPGAALAALTADELDAAVRTTVAPVHHLDSLAAPDATLVVLTPLHAVWGAARRGAASAALTTLDALAGQRRARGLPTLVVAVGGQEPGAAAADRPLAPDTVTARLHHLLDHGATGEVIADVDLTRIIASIPSTRALGLMRELPEIARALRETPADDGAPAAELAARLAPLDEPARRRELLDLVLGHAAAVLGHSDRKAVRPDRAFSDSGFDSMFAVQFRNQLRTSTGVPLSATVVFDHPTPEALVDVLHDELFSGTAASAQALAELQRLEALLEGLDPDLPGGREIGVRLTNLVRRFTAPSDPADDGERIDGATADELFDLLDNNYGMA